MEPVPGKTSTGLALRNPVFRKLWLAMVISGSCVAAQNTAIYWALNALGATTVLISLMATVSALPATLFTLPAGALADMLDRKTILLAVQLWQAAIAFGLAILWAAHLLNPYLILAGAFLFSLGFAFSSPATSAAIAEMVSAEALASAYTLSGLQLDVSGIIGPLLGGLLIPLAGVSVIFGADGVGFLLMFLALFQWKRARPQSNLPLETFFESLTTAIRYVRYTAGIKILLARHALFSFFISIIPALMPVVGLKELHLEASNLGYLFTAMAAGSVLSGAFALPWARARYSPEQITTGANLALMLDFILMVLVHQPYVFLGVAALGGAGWTVSASELWVASQRAMPDWARGRMSATMTMAAQGATALGGALWGLAAQGFGVVPTFLGSAGFALLLMVLVHVVPALNLSIDFTTSVTFERAPMPFLQNLATSRRPAP
jgi:MFS family permease